MRNYFFTLFFIGLISLAGKVQSAVKTQNERIPLVSYNLNVYPQPGDGFLNLLFSEAPVETPQVVVYDIIGNKIAELEVVRNDAKHFSIDLSAKKPGYYFIKVNAGEQHFTRRITVQR